MSSAGVGAGSQLLSGEYIQYTLQFIQKTLQHSSYSIPYILLSAYSTVYLTVQFVQYMLQYNSYSILYSTMHIV